MLLFIGGKKYIMKIQWENVLKLDMALGKKDVLTNKKKTIMHLAVTFVLTLSLA